jgi:hypothetical protein
MHIELDEGLITNAAEAVDLTGLDDKNGTTSQDTTGPSNRNFGRWRSDVSLRGETPSRTRQI